MQNSKRIKWGFLLNLFHQVITWGDVRLETLNLYWLHTAPNFKNSWQHCHKNRTSLGTSGTQRLKLSLFSGVGSIEIYYLILIISKYFFLCNTADHAGTLRVNCAILNFRFHNLRSTTCIRIRDYFTTMWWHMQNVMHNVDILFKMCIKFKLYIEITSKDVSFSFQYILGLSC